MESEGPRLELGLSYLPQINLWPALPYLQNGGQGAALELRLNFQERDGFIYGLVANTEYSAEKVRVEGDSYRKLHSSANRTAIHAGIYMGGRGDVLGGYLSVMPGIDYLSGTVEEGEEGEVVTQPAGTGAVQLSIEMNAGIEVDLSGIGLQGIALHGGLSALVNRTPHFEAYHDFNADLRGLLGLFYRI
ncbi:MAG: hypothetical protein Q7S00_05560 [bacterium]|nr:hypothetical protein [bacterium]